MGQPIRLETNEQIQITGDVPAEFAEILTPDALRFVADLQRRFGPVRERLLARRGELQIRLDHGLFPDFLSETRELREADWRVASVPAELEDRRVEITGPVDRKMVINALNSGARVYMADFEDSHSPTWKATIEGQLNLRDAVRRTITFQSPDGKSYALKEKTAVMMVRPRGWHLEEKHMWVDGRPVSASLFDFGLFFFHNAEALLRRGSRPYFYLPKMESHQEAKLWNDVFVEAQGMLGMPVGTIKATVLIETILAAFEMHEILYELKDHSAGLNCGRWDYIFSFIKKFRSRPEFVLPDRAQVTMTTHFLKSYSELLIQTCHRRGAHAMGGMAAQIPIKGDEAANAQAMEKVRADKLREVKAGHDGTWVAHPGLVELATKIFDEGMPGPNQLERLREDVKVGAQDLLAVPQGTITEQGLRTNINVGLLYLTSWLEGTGCVPLYHLMEDAATAEISRAQVWQWVHHPAGKLQDGAKIDASMVQRILSDEMARYSGRGQALERAGELMERMCLEPRFAEFLTLEAYRYL